MLREVNARELTELEALYTRIEPLGYERVEQMLAVLCAVVRNSSGFGGKKRKAAKPTDYLPKYDKAPKKQLTLEERILAAKRLTVSMGGKVVGADGKKVEF